MASELRTGLGIFVIRDGGLHLVRLLSSECFYKTRTPLLAFLRFFFCFCPCFRSMERKAANEVSLQAPNESRMFSTDVTRQSFWDDDGYLDEIFWKTTVFSDAVDSGTPKTSIDAIGGSSGEFFCQMGERLQESDSTDINTSFDNQEMKSPLSSCGKLAQNHLWSQNQTSKHSGVSVTIDSQSSICVASPPSPNQTTGQHNQGANSSSSHELSNDEDGCEQSTDPAYLKRKRRKLSNRDSARRSRKRKQAEMTELESQVVNLQEENASLCKHLTDASRLYRDADTNNRVLKSGMEALRAKVKLAEDTLARGSLSYSLNQLVQNHLNIAIEPQLNGLRSNESSTMSLQEDRVAYAGMAASGQNSGHTFGDMGSIMEDVKCSIGSDVSDIWP